MRFALLQMKIAIAKLILKFEFSTCEQTTIPMQFNPTTPFLTPKADIFLTLHTL
jgi:cytochrome P450